MVQELYKTLKSQKIPACSIFFSLDDKTELQGI